MNAGHALFAPVDDNNANLHIGLQGTGERDFLAFGASTCNKETVELSVPESGRNRINWKAPEDTLSIFCSLRGLFTGTFTCY